MSGAGIYARDQQLRPFEEMVGTIDGVVGDKLVVPVPPKIAAGRGMKEPPRKAAFERTGELQS